MSNENVIICKGVREYSEELPVKIRKLKKKEAEAYKDVSSNNCISGYKEERYVVHADNEAGHNCTEVDIVDLFNFIKNNIPELFEKLIGDGD